LEALLVANMASLVATETYTCEVCVRSFTCRGCHLRLNTGEVRLVRLRGAQRTIYHPACLFTLFDRLSPDDIVVQSVDDLLGFQTLPDDDKIILEDLLSSHHQTRARAAATGDSEGASTSTHHLTSTPAQPPSKRAKLTHQISPLVITDDEEDSPKITLPVLPNLLEGVEIPEGPARTYDECSVCLDPPVHPVKLPCSHIFCYLCAKGLVRSGTSGSLCSMCRQAIPDGFLESAAVLRKASQELNDTPPVESSGSGDWQWFYEGKNGWWRFEKRNNEELEENLRNGIQAFETMICGNIYVMDLVKLEQYQKDRPQRKRKLKRDMKSMECKGVAGLGKRSWNPHAAYNG